MSVARKSRRAPCRRYAGRPEHHPRHRPHALGVPAVRDVSAPAAFGVNRSRAPPQLDRDSLPADGWLHPVQFPRRCRSGSDWFGRPHRHRLRGPHRRAESPAGDGAAPGSAAVRVCNALTVVRIAIIGAVEVSAKRCCSIAARAGRSSRTRWYEKEPERAIPCPTHRCWSPRWPTPKCLVRHPSPGQARRRDAGRWAEIAVRRAHAASPAAQRRAKVFVGGGRGRLTTATSTTGESCFARSAWLG
mgnify:CR=1 FL=1